LNRESFNTRHRDVGRAVIYRLEGTVEAPVAGFEAVDGPLRQNVGTVAEDYFVGILGVVVR
jgi:hypothetical protein